VTDARIRSIDAAGLHEIAEAFHAHHRNEYTFASEREPIDLVSVRCDAVVPLDEPGREFGSLAGDDPSAAPDEPAPAEVIFASGEDQRSVRVEARRVNRGALATGDELHGPAVIHDVGSTILLPPGSRARVDASANLIIDWSTR
jgi:N-methylhydantoinase A